MNIPESFLTNQTFDSRAIGFNRQLLPTMIMGGTYKDTNIGYKVMPDGSIQIYSKIDRLSDYSALAAENGIGLLEFVRKELNLEDYYMSLVG